MRTINAQDITKAINLVERLMEIVKIKFQKGLENEVYLA